MPSCLSAVPDAAPLLVVINVVAQNNCFVLLNGIDYSTAFHIVRDFSEPHFE